MPIFKKLLDFCSKIGQLQLSPILTLQYEREFKR